MESLTAGGLVNIKLLFLSARVLKSVLISCLPQFRFLLTQD
jgi:hypothetical protein